MQAAVDTTGRLHPFGTVNVSSAYRPPFARATGSATQPPDTPGSLMQRTNAMRDFRDAKTMAQTLRESLTAKAFTISHSESLELVSKMLGVADWNTLSALLQAERRDSGVPAAKRLGGAVIYPAIPLRDLVPFPTATFPLFVGREKTIQALD